jgi:hypothetical protein
MTNESAKAFPRPTAVVAALAFALLVGGCATVQDWADSIGGASADGQKSTGTDGEKWTGVAAGSTAVKTAEDPGRQKLAEGVALYEAGDFVGAIRALNAPEIGRSDATTRIEANKYLAFSYCVTNRRTLCRRSFDRVLAIDPAFALKPAEAGHPLWGPVFVQARKAADQRSN